jgi:hypothetical protein
MAHDLTIPMTPAVSAARAEFNQARQRYVAAADATSAEFALVKDEHTRILKACWDRGLRSHEVDRDPAMVALLKPYHDAKAGENTLYSLCRHHEIYLLAAVHTELSHHTHHIPVVTVEARGKKWQYFFDGHKGRTSGASSPYTAAALVLHAVVTETVINAQWCCADQYSMTQTQMEKAIRSHRPYVRKHDPADLTMNLSWRVVPITRAAKAA